MRLRNKRDFGQATYTGTLDLLLGTMHHAEEGSHNILYFALLERGVTWIEITRYPSINALLAHRGAFFA